MRYFYKQAIDWPLLRQSSITEDLTVVQSICYASVYDSVVKGLDNEGLSIYVLVDAPYTISPTLYYASRTSFNNL